jgi:hypothetical protein
MSDETHGPEQSTPVDPPSAASPIVGGTPSEDPDKSQRQTPWHLWVVGGIGLPWNAMGAFDYLMTQTENESYMANFTPEQLEFFYGFPTWLVAFWAIAVWGGLVGSVLLLMKKRLAAQVFLVSWVCMIVTAIHNFLITDGAEVMGPAGMAFTAVIFVFAGFEWLYSRAMTQRGVLS